MKITVPGWNGKLEVGPLRADGTRVVAFDARSPDGWWVYDTTSMTPKQLYGWTKPRTKRKALR